MTGKLYVDWISAGTQLLSQNVGAFVLSDGTFTEVYPIESKQKMPENVSLNYSFNDVGIPEKFKRDRAPELCMRNSEFLKSVKQKVINLTYTEPDFKNQIAPIDVDIR